MRVNERTLRAAERVRRAALSPTCRHEAIVWRWRHVWEAGQEMSHPILLLGDCPDCGLHATPHDLAKLGIEELVPEPARFEDYFAVPEDAVHHALEQL